MVTKKAWLEAGLRMLAKEGYGALRIERLAGALGVSKGSFYHHFSDGMPGFRRELLAHYEQEHTQRHFDTVAAEDQTPADRLRLLRRLVMANEDQEPRRGANIRTWAAHDDDARRTLERVDAARIEYLRALWEAISGDAEAATPMARLLYVMLIGAQHLLPPLEPSEIDQLYEVVLAAVLEDEP